MMILSGVSSCVGAKANLLPSLNSLVTVVLAESPPCLVYCQYAVEAYLVIS